MLQAPSAETTLHHPSTMPPPKEASETAPLQSQSINSSMSFEHIYIFPLSVFVLVPITVIVSYIIAVANGHVLPLFPFISDAGALPPESCIFGQLLNICALLMGISIYLRHRQIVTFYQYAARKHRLLIFISTVLLWLGLLASSGLSLVANFQENRVLTVHLIGAMLAFVVGAFYAWAQTALTFVMRFALCPLWVAIIRVFLCVAQTGFLASMMACGGLHHESKNGTSTLPHKFDPSDEGYPAYICSTASEWCMSFAFICYFLTFAVDFRRCNIVGSRFVLTIAEEDFPTDGSQSTSVPRYTGGSEDLTTSTKSESINSGSPRASSVASDDHRLPISIDHNTSRNNSPPPSTSDRIYPTAE